MTDTDLNSETVAVPKTGETTPESDRGLRLFRFLAEVQRLKTPRITSVKTYIDDADGMFVWLKDVPEHGLIHLSLRDSSEGIRETVISARRVGVDPAPELPKTLISWVSDDTGNPERPPALRDSITAVSGDPVESKIEDHPKIRDAYDQWRGTWDVWADKARADMAAAELYRALFRAYRTTVDRSEEYELVVASGCLGWAPPGGTAVKRHLLACPADISFDDRTSEITVVFAPEMENIKIETDALDPGMLNAPELLPAVIDDARESEQTLLHRTDAGELLTRLVNVLDPDGKYVPTDNEPGNLPDPEVTFAPALILRKRTRQGMRDIFARIIREIDETNTVPSGLLPLIDPDFEPASMPDPSEGSLVEVDDEILSPLPLNAEQLRVLRNVDRNAQTVVQGPPGTGKTHTAAALLSHLLAQGKRVLVTAYTDQALVAVRDTLPEEIKPLAVSVIGSSRKEMSDLQVAVERISDESSRFEEEQSAADIAACLSEIDRIRRERAGLRTAIVDARKSESNPVSVAGYQGSLVEVAKRCAEEADTFSWSTELFPAGVGGEFPLSTDELLRWLGLLRDTALRNGEAEARQRLVDLNRVPDPQTLAQMFDTETGAASAASRLAPSREHPAFAAVSRMSRPDRATLKGAAEYLARMASDLEGRREPWMSEALSDVRSGRADLWVTRASKIRALVDEAHGLIAQIPDHTQVSLTPGTDPGIVESLARGLRDYLTETGPLKLGSDGMPKIGALTNRAVKNSRLLFEAVRVDRRVPTSAEDLTTVLNYLDAEHRLDALDRAWPDSVAVRSEDTPWERVQAHVAELKLLYEVVNFSTEIQRAYGFMSDRGVMPPDWRDTRAIGFYAVLADAADAGETQAVSTTPLSGLAESLNSEGAWENASPAMAEMSAAVSSRDLSGYERAHGRLRTLHAMRAALEECDALTFRVTGAAPRLADAVLSDADDPVWDSRLRETVGAWNWTKASEWVRGRETVDINALQSSIRVLDDQLLNQIAQLSSLRAWRHAVSPQRLTGQSRSDLKHYAQLVRRLGKGKGKYAVQQRSDIRDAMRRCRTAVPVWIMPIHRIAEQFEITQNMFDVIVVDEASQAGLEASFLQYLAPKIVVIGDDKQVSPSAVGVDQQQLRDLAKLYLYDDPHRSSWEDPKQSFFDEAVKRFGARLTLLEHRRCVPEIIGFSSLVAYEPENIHLRPVRQVGSDRIEPIRVVRVTDGYTKGTTLKTNPPEVGAITAQLLECLDDPRYDGKTFGVISLQGTAQAKLIESAVMRELDPVVVAQRKLSFGDAARFQGSERDVVFLSMVAARSEDTRLGSSVGPTYVQRYNVAASRAKDQLWLFHSIDIEDVNNPEDMRHQLLKYCYRVAGNWDTHTDSAHLEPVSEDVRVAPFDSLFEQRVYNRMVSHGLNVEPQHEAGGYRIDLVVVGRNYKLAVECDGDEWHGPDAYERDLARQRDLERCGWTFFRIRESEFYANQHAVLARLWAKVDEMEGAG